MKKNPLFFVFLIPVIVDVLGTVLGQPAAYWQSHFQIFSEAAPVYPLLQIHPLVFIVVTLAVWLTFTYFLVLKLKKPYDLWSAMVLFAGHAYNSVAWLRIVHRKWGIFAGMDQLSLALSLIPMTIYILFIGWIASKALLNYFKKKG